MKDKIKETIYFFSSRLLANQDSKVIYYHDIHSTKRYTDMSTDIMLFRQHMNILKQKGYITVTNISSPKNEIEITFDDGFQGIYENFSLFLENKIPVRVFLISGFIGKKNYMDKNQIEELLKTGLFTIGSHTVCHENLNELDDNKAFYEIKKSKEDLEDMFGEEVDTFCYPRGRFTNKTIEHTWNAGYKRQYTCLPGSYLSPFRTGLINRSLVQHATIKEFSYILDGADRVFHKRYLNQQYTEK